MSTLAYAALTNTREDAPAGTSTAPGQSPGVATYVDALAALVPAEVLTAHAAILTFTTTTVGGEKPVVTVSDPETLKFVFWSLIVLSIVVYVFGRWRAKMWDKFDWVRMLIPAAAFVGWTMLQKATAFDALNLPGFSSGMRSAVAIIGAIVLGLVASALAYRADQKPPAP